MQPCVAVSPGHDSSHASVRSRGCRSPDMHHDRPPQRIERPGARDAEARQPSDPTVGETVRTLLTPTTKSPIRSTSRRQTANITVLQAFSLIIDAHQPDGRGLRREGERSGPQARSATNLAEAQEAHREGRGPHQTTSSRPTWERPDPDRFPRKWRLGRHGYLEIESGPAAKRAPSRQSPEQGASSVGGSGPIATISPFRFAITALGPCRTVPGIENSPAPRGSSNQFFIGPSRC